MPTLWIGELASKGDVHLETIRYYGTRRTAADTAAHTVSECPILESLDSERPS